MNDTSSISARLRTSVRLDAVNGDSYERAVCESQMFEAATVIDGLIGCKAELQRVTEAADDPRINNTMTLEEWVREAAKKLRRMAEEAENEYRKKPVVIDAVLWDGSTEALIQIEEWIRDGAQIDFTKEDLPGIIPTSLGGVTFRLGDYVIRGVKGEVYPCKANIFEQTYEALT
jgi:hypothetical protein